FRVLRAAVDEEDQLDSRVVVDRAAHLVGKRHERVIRIVIHGPVEEDGPSTLGTFRFRVPKRVRREEQDTGEDKTRQERDRVRLHRNKLLNAAFGMRRWAVIRLPGSPMNFEPGRCDSTRPVTLPLPTLCPGWARPRMRSAWPRHQSDEVRSSVRWR